MPAPDHDPSATSARLLLVGVLALTLALAGCASTENDGEAQADDEQATLAFDFDGERADDPQRIEETVEYDPDARPTMELYESTDAERPDAYTVHDLLADYESQSDTDIQVNYKDGLGYRLVSVDGVPGDDGSGSWALYVDGEEETASLGTLTVDESSSYEWRHQATSTSGADSQDPQQGDSDDPDDSSDTSDPDGSEEPYQGSEDSGTQATMVVDYNGFRNEDPQRTEHTVSYDPDTRPTWHRYEESGTDRPDAYILHDLVSDWSNQTDTDYTVRETDETGYRLQSIDSVTAHSTRGGSWTWQLQVNGEHETAGISTVQIDPSATYEWTFTRVSGS